MKRGKNNASVLFEPEAGRIVLGGGFGRSGIEAFCRNLERFKPRTRAVTINMSALASGDAELLADVVLYAQSHLARRKIRVVLEGATPANEALFAKAANPEARVPVVKKTPESFFESAGKFAVALWRDVMDMFAFLGEVAVCALRDLRRPRKIRWLDAAKVFETAGVNAIPVVMLIGFLLGLILAFQSAIPLKMFGAEIYVANLIGIAVIRELGALVAAIAMAGRTSSAFAAEIGTMVINDEVNALATMGIKPVRFLVTHRILAVAVALPLLSIFADVAALAGGWVVVGAMGYSFSSYVSHAVAFVPAGHLYGSLFKAVVFGVIVAGVGCLRGLQTGKGAGAVGDSATRAVVSAIVAVAIADGVFAVVFYALGI